MPACAAAAALALLIPFVRRAEPGIGGVMSAGVTLWLSFLLTASAACLYGQFGVFRDGAVGEYAPYMLRCAGIGFFCRAASDVCRDSGEASVGDRILTAGKLGMLAVCAPLIKELLERALGYINGAV